MGRIIGGQFRMKWRVGISVIMAFVAIGCTSQAFASSESDILKKADSLYAARQYTQALEVYQSLHEGGRYTPSMLLKMAYIQEGLGHLGESLYYLNLYFLATDDAQALKKMEELAEKNNLEGYETNETTKIMAWLQQYATIAFAIAALGVFWLSLMFYQRTRKSLKPSLTGIALVITMAFLFLHINFSTKAERGIVASPQAYLMSGPSAGASVVAIIGEGHQLQIKGKEDVWLKVSWKDNDVYVKDFLVKPVRL